MKSKIFAILVLLSITLSGCGKEKPLMDVPAEDGKFHYENFSLKFSLVLPPEFDHYQTQRRDYANFIDVEFFVPTSDKDYVNAEFPSYAKPIVVRVYNQGAWDNDEGFEIIKETKTSIYTLKFWEKQPRDWDDKWSEEMKQAIVSDFNLE